jgi:hypothetical protein
VGVDARALENKTRRRGSVEIGLAPSVFMEKITKKELENIVLHGLATDIFIAERSFLLFKTIGEKNEEIIENKNFLDFFKGAQDACKDQFLIATSRLFDSPSERNKTRCVAGVLKFLSKNSEKLPKIIERPNLLSVMKDISFSEETLNLVRHEGKDSEITLRIVNHFDLLLKSSKNQRLLTKLKEIRDKRLVHNELKNATATSLTETIDSVTFKDLFSLVETAKNFVGVIGWAYMSMVFMHNGNYVLGDSAHHPANSLKRLVDQLKK